MISLKIRGHGGAKPARTVASEELDGMLNLAVGSCYSKSGVKQRSVRTDETCTELGATAARAALASADLVIDDIDLIISCSNMRDQFLPGNGPRLQRELTGGRLSIPAFDVNAVCLGFVAALDVAAAFLATGRYKRILLVAAEIVWAAVDREHLESISLFGDGAAAFIIERDANSGSGVGLLSSKMQTHAQGFELCEARGGGVLLPPWEFTKDLEREYRFRMDGPRVFRLVRGLMRPFYETLLADAGVKKEDIALVIPHQASASALELLRRHLEIPTERYYVNVEEHGNMVSASIPFALHEALSKGRIKSGDLIALVGTSAGVSIGGAILRL